MSEPPSVPGLPAAERWAALLDGWGVPQRILDGAPESPFGYRPDRFAVDVDIDRASRSAAWAREVLPPVGATVLDVGCGGGKASVPLVPPASELIGVDRRADMLEAFASAATRAGVARRTIHGEWPEVASTAPVADVVVCHHVVFGVTDLAPFLIALTARARLAVVLEMSTEHPMSVWSPGWRHFWDLERPPGPNHDDLVAVLRELSIDPEVATSVRAPRSSDRREPDDLVPDARRRWCLTDEFDDEIRQFLDEHPLEWPETMATIRWPGAADVDP